MDLGALRATEGGMTAKTLTDLPAELQEMVKQQTDPIGYLAVAATLLTLGGRKIDPSSPEGRDVDEALKLVNAALEKIAAKASKR
jgi:hypothetical protein